MVINKNSLTMMSISGQTLIVKTNVLGTGSLYVKIITAPPATITALNDEIISIPIEDGNGEGTIVINGGSGDFTLYKLPLTTPNDDYETGINLGNNAGSVNYRYLSDLTSKIFVLDNVTNYGQSQQMLRDVHNLEMYFGDQIQVEDVYKITREIPDFQYMDDVELAQELTKRLVSTGYDGSIMEYPDGNILAMVFEPNQIKSVSNDKSWDTNDNDIYS
jgi:hypothetical protein